MVRIVSKQGSGIRLSRDGRWFHAGEPFTNGNVIRFFHRAIRKDEHGGYYLYNRPANFEEHVYFEVDDTAYFVWDLARDSADGEFRILLNTEAIEVLDLRTLHEDERGVMYCRVLDGDRARFTLQALTRLADHAETDERGIYIARNGERIYIPAPNPGCPGGQFSPLQGDFPHDGG